MTETERAQEVARGPRRRFLQNIALVAAVLLALAAFVGQGYQLQQRAETAEKTTISLAQQVQQECADGGSIDVNGRDLCLRADDVVQSAPVAGPVGDRGPQGERGFMGPRGDTGPRGARGPEGDQGPRGERGPEGDRGLQGEQGAQGDTGPKGDTGPMGDPGPKGDTGATGDRGPKGDTGPAGPAGPACREGYVPTQLYVQTRTDPMLPLTQAWRLATICTPS